MPTQYQVAAATNQPNYFNKDADNPLYHDVHGGVRTSNWMIQIDDVMNSNVDGFEDHAQLFAWQASSERQTTGDFANNLFTSATLAHSPVIVEVAYGDFGPVLEGKMNTGQHLDSITLVRLGNIKDLKVKMQTIVFGNCRIRRIEQIGDHLIIEFYPTTKENTVFKFGQDGTAAGQTVTKADYAKAVAE